MFTLFRITFALARKLYRIGLLFRHKNGDFWRDFCNGAKRRCRSLKRRVTYHRIRVHIIPDNFVVSALKWKIMQNFGEQTMCVLWDVKMVDFPVCPSYRESPCPPTLQSDQEPQEPGYRSCLLVVSWWFRFALTIRELSSFSISTSLRLYSFTSSCFFSDVSEFKLQRSRPQQSPPKLVSLWHVT